MLAQQLPGFANELQKSALAGDNFWSLELHEMKPLMVEFFYHRAKVEDRLDQARQLITSLQRTLMEQGSNPMITREDLVVMAHRVPDEIFTLDDLMESLTQMTEVRQNAVLFALETNMAPEAVINLKWDDRIELPVTKYVQFLLTNQKAHRHVSLPYVFWEWHGKLAMPLATLKEDAEFAFGKSWPAIVASYRDMRIITPQADAAHLRELLDQLHLLD